MSDNALTDRQKALYPTMNRNALAGPSEAEVQKQMFDSVWDNLTNPQEVNIRHEMRSLAGKMAHHHDHEVRQIAMTLLRCVERLETGR